MNTEQGDGQPQPYKVLGFKASMDPEPLKLKGRNSLFGETGYPESITFNLTTASQGCVWKKVSTEDVQLPNDGKSQSDFISSCSPADAGARVLLHTSAQPLLLRSLSCSFYYMFFLVYFFGLEKGQIFSLLALKLTSFVKIVDNEESTRNWVAITQMETVTIDQQIACIPQSLSFHGLVTVNVTDDRKKISCSVIRSMHPHYVVYL